jgi:hypothetical protein
VRTATRWWLVATTAVGVSHLAALVLAVLMSVPAMLVVRLCRGAHPVLGPFAAACAGPPVVTVVRVPVPEAGT